MYKANVNNRYNFTLKGDDNNYNIIEIKSTLHPFLNGEGRIFHIIKDNKSYNTEVLKANNEEKNFTIRVNGNKYTVQLKDKYDELLEKLGIRNNASEKIKELKAPMPGLVVDVRVQEGVAVKKGDALVVLQAMKMENILKCPADAIVKKIHVKKDSTIEKNQLLISFD